MIVEVVIPGKFRAGFTKDDAGSLVNNVRPDNEVCCAETGRLRSIAHPVMLCITMMIRIITFILLSCCRSITGNTELIPESGIKKRTSL